MQPEEQRLIDGLFTRLQQAQTQSAPRDAGAEKSIAQHVQAQPAAPYYMAQTILIQEAAIKQLNEQIQALENSVAQLKSTRQSSGSFLAGLFGKEPQQRDNNAIPGAQNYGRQPAAPQPDYGQAPRYASPAGGFFMSGALQTAAGVAGGVVLGNMLMNMFSGTHPQEIVNIIEETPQSEANGIAPAADSHPLPQDSSGDTDSGWGNDDTGNGDAGWDNSDTGNDDFGNDDFGSDDDSWI